MSISNVLLPLVPKAQLQYIEALRNAEEDLRPYGILENKTRAAMFFAQVFHETGGFRILEENMNYSAERIVQVWPKRFPSIAVAKPFEHNPQALANKTYGGRMGNIDQDDGWKFRGRGPLQLTGRSSYKTHGDRLGIDLVANPTLALDPRYCLVLAAAEWKASGCNQFADSDDFEAVTKAINGGMIGFDSRLSWYHKVLPIMEEYWKTLDSSSKKPVTTAVKIKAGAAVAATTTGVVTTTLSVSEQYSVSPLYVALGVAAVLAVVALLFYISRHRGA